MTGVTVAHLARQCAYVAKSAGQWSGDLLTIEENALDILDHRDVARFTDEIRRRLNHLDYLAGRPGVTAPWEGKDTPMQAVDLGGIQFNQDGTYHLIDPSKPRISPSFQMFKLAWFESNDDSWVAETQIGDYEIHKVGYGDSEEWELSSPTERVGLFAINDLDVAKGKAQLDFVGKIQAALLVENDKSDFVNGV